jgi:hypothetical protein
MDRAERGRLAAAQGRSDRKYTAARPCPANHTPRDRWVATDKCVLCGQEQNRLSKERSHRKRVKTADEQGRTDGKYQDTKTCRHGHRRPLRYVNNGRCVKCHKASILHHAGANAADRAATSLRQGRTDGKYRDTKTCLNGHVGPVRRVSDGVCIECRCLSRKRAFVAKTYREIEDEALARERVDLRVLGSKLNALRRVLNDKGK